ncbi:MAG TPA: hypothetical protein VI455_06540 [Terriglobia bacterium]
MTDLRSNPFLVFALSMFVMWLAARIGGFFRKRRPLKEEAREEYGFVQAATLTLLALIIGFTFSMAIGRYDQRRNDEEEEANTIGTEYVRTGLLPAADGARLRALLTKYLNLRVLFYRTRNERDLQKVNADTAQLQAEMWSAVQTAAAAQPTPVTALAVTGMNGVLNSQGYTQAAWWNRIPTAAWGLMILIAVCCNVLVGYGGRSAQARASVLFVLPLIVSIAFLLIADIDSPRGGLIHVPPQNLVSLSQSLPPQ